MAPPFGIATWPGALSHALPTIWPFRGKAATKVKVLSYNLEWWATGGAGANRVIEASSKDLVYDFMGFQECNDPWHVLWAGDLHNHVDAAGAPGPDDLRPVVALGLSPLDQEEAPDDDDGDADGAETETEQGVQETVPVATLVTTA